jgi:hypothetical protein
MLTWENDVEATALRAQGSTISAIARHLGHDRKTIRDYLSGERSVGERASSRTDPFEESAEYCKIRLSDDRHLWASALFERSSRWVMGVRIRVSPAACGAAGCGRTANRVGPRRVAIMRSSTTSPVRRRSSTGWSCPTHRPGGGFHGASVGRCAGTFWPVAGGARRDRRLTGIRLCTKRRASRRLM